MEISMRTRQHTKGFTLVEALVVVSIMAVLATVAVPNLAAAVARQRTVDTANTLVGSMHMARLEAVRRNVVVTVCRSTDPMAADQAGRACSNAVAGTVPAADWGAGWIVFARSGAANPADADPGVFEPGDTVLFRTAFDNVGVTRNVINANIGSGPIAFRGDGTRIGATAVFTVEYHQPADAFSAVARCVRVEGSDAARVTRSDSGVCA
jgi:prepilin-type N-terminal cleavage/methylation domain-containing protein